MRDFDPWNNFLQSGSIFDYLTYKNLQEVDEENGSVNEGLAEEPENENQDRWFSN